MLPKIKIRNSLLTDAEIATVSGQTKTLLEQRQISKGELQLTDLASSPKRHNGRSAEMYAGVYDETFRRRKFMETIET